MDPLDVTTAMFELTDVSRDNRYEPQGTLQSLGSQSNEDML